MKKLQLSVALLGLAMVACTNENVVVEESEGIETISAEIVQPGNMGSRLIIGEQNEGNYPMKWRADDPNTTPNEADVIYVYDSEGNAGRFVYNETAAAPKGIFVRDKKHGSAIKDIKNALCVPTSVGRPSDLPASIDDKFNYMSTMTTNRGAENAPMYAIYENGTLKFHIVTGMIELNIPNLAEFRPSADKMLGVQIRAFDEKGNPKYISAKEANIDFSNPENPVVKLIADKNEFIGLFIQAGISMTNKLYFPLLTGNYSKLEIDLWSNVQFNDPTRRMSTTVTLTPTGGKEFFTIEKKVYSVTKEFTNLKDVKEGITAPSLPAGNTDSFEVSGI